MTVLDYLINSNMDIVIRMGKEKGLVSLEDAINYIKSSKTHQREFAEQLSDFDENLNVLDMEYEGPVLESCISSQSVINDSLVIKETNNYIKKTDKNYKHNITIKFVIYALVALILILLGFLTIKSVHADNYNYKGNYEDVHFTKSIQVKAERVVESINDIEDKFIAKDVVMNELPTFSLVETKRILIEQFFNNLDELYDAGIKDIAGYENASVLDEWLYLYENYGVDFIIDKVMENYLSGNMGDILAEFYQAWNRTDGELYLQFDEDYFDTYNGNTDED